MDNQNLPVIRALWVGKRLGRLSRCCLSSFVRRGHQVCLYTYEQVEDVPEGVEVCDANQIVPADKIIRHKATGSYALFSDIFRYELLKKAGGIYVDCDVYCLKPFEIPEHGYLLGYEEDRKINGAVLALPADSGVLNALSRIVGDKHFIPSWYSKSRVLRIKWKKRLGLIKDISEMPWGVIGPDAITYFIKQARLESRVQDIDIFYPVHYGCIRHLLNPHLTVQDITTSRTKAVHLYNEMLKDVDLDGLDGSSVLAKMLSNEI